MKEAYLDPSTLHVPDPPKVPRSKVCGRMEEFVKYVLRADQAGGVELFGDDELRRDEDGNIISAGFFAILKSPEKDRVLRRLVWCI